MSLGFSIHSIMSSSYNDNFTSSLPMWVSFISFSCLIAVTRTSNTMLNRRSESGQPCLVLDLKGNGFNFSPLRTMLAVGLSYKTFIMLRLFPSMPTFWRVFILNGVEFC